MVESYDRIFEQFEGLFPNFASEAVGFYSSSICEITVMLEDRSRVIYNYETGAIKFLKARPENEIRDELFYRHLFASKLKHKLELNRMSVQSLSNRTGIHTQTLYKYLSGKSTPSGYNLLKIAEAMYCSPSEFYFDG